MHDQTARDLENGQASPEPGLYLADPPRGQVGAGTMECPRCKLRVQSSDHSCRGCGTELIDPTTTTTTTTITSDPAPAAPAGGPLVRKLDPVQNAPINSSGWTMFTPQPTTGTVVGPPPTFSAAGPNAAAAPTIPGNAEDYDQPEDEGPVTLVDPDGDSTAIGPAPHEPPEEFLRNELNASGGPAGDTQLTAVPTFTEEAPTQALTGPAPFPMVAADPGATVTFEGTYLFGGRVAERVHVPEGESFEIGRIPGTPFAGDPFLARYHAALISTPEGFLVEDFGSINGLFVRLTTAAELRDGDQFRIGEELLSYEELPAVATDDDGVQALGCPNPGYWSKINVLLTPEQVAATYPVDEAEVIFGREDGHVIFPDDSFCSAEHCRLTVDDQGALLEDLGSQNGTFLRVRAGEVLPYGSVILAGRTLIKLERSG